MDPNEVLEEGFEDNLNLWPQKLPEGVTKDAKQFYAHRRAFADGRVVWEFFQRGKPLPAGQAPQDRVFATVTEKDDKVAEKFKKEQAAAEKDADRTPPTRVINGVPHERGEDGVYRPVQTEAGAAQAGATSQPQAAAPGGKPFIDDGEDAGASGRRWGWNPETRLYDRDLGPSPAAQKPAAASDTIGKPTGNTRQRTEGNTVTKETEYLLPDGTREWRSQTASEAPSAVDQVGKPTGNTRQATEGNRTVKETEYVLPDGTKEWRRQEESGSGKKYVQTQQDKNTGAWYGLTPDGTWEPIEGGPGSGSGVTLPAGMARPRFTAGEVANELSATRDKLDAWVAEGATDAERSSRKAEAIQAMQQAHQLASTYLTEQQQLQGTARDVFGTQVSQRGQDASMINQRTSAGASMANQAVGSFVPMLRYAQAGSGDPVAAFQALMGLMRGNVEQMGGMVDLPRVGVPSAIPQAAQGQMQPPQTGTRTVVPAGVPPIVQGTAPQAAQPQATTVQITTPQPQAQVAIPQAPSVPQILAGSVPEAVSAPTPITANPTSTPAPTGLPAPIFAPQPEAMLPPPAVMQTVLDMVEPLMAQDPNWGMDDLDLIRQGVGPAMG